MMYTVPSNVLKCTRKFIIIISGVGISQNESAGQETFTMERYFKDKDQHVELCNS